VDRVLPTIIIVVALAIMLGLMLWGWRNLRRRQSSLTAPLGLPVNLGPSELAVDGWYVATTRAHEPLERIAAHGLGFRALATVAVHSTGVVLDRRGSDSVFVPRVDLREASLATWAIDRVVERNGLVVIGWMLGETPVDSYLRCSENGDADRLVTAIRAMVPTPDAVEEVES
jgi:hypothetical protein